MRKPTKGRQVRDMLTTLTGQSVDDEQYMGKKVYTRKGTPSEGEAGEVTNTSICTLRGCGGTRLHVLWSDGHRTYPCAKGCVVREDGDLQIR